MNAYSNVSIGFAGDVMIGRSLDRIIAQEGFLYPWGDLLPLLRSTDVNIANLETALTLCTQKVDKVFNFRSAPQNVQALIEANIGIVSLANNHVLDYTEEGLIETINTLDAVEIYHTGAGRNEKEAMQPVITQLKNGMRLGVLGITDNEKRWKAGPCTSGIHHIDIYNRKERETALALISRLCADVDLLVVSVHWGPNMVVEPPEAFIDFAHGMADQGVDVVHGHSAHIFQGIELCHNKIILYDTGDFVDDYVVDPELRNDLSFFYKLTIGPSGIEGLILHPVTISNYQVNHANVDDREWCLKKVRELSSAFGTLINDKGEVIMKKILGSIT